MKNFKSNSILNLWSLLILVIYLIVNSSSLKAQSEFCSTVATSNTVGCDAALHSMDEKGPFFIKIYVHVIRKDDGTGGQSQQDIEEALGYLDLAFNDHNIFFVWDCEVDPINNSSLYSQFLLAGNVFTESNNVHQDGIDIYLFPDHPYPLANGSGLANMNETAFYVTGNNNLPPYGSRVKSHVISHEMGHCLGLLHTHHFTNVFAHPVTGQEIVDQSNDPGNCLVAGDCVCDTPADPIIIGEVNHPSCEWTGFGVDFYGDQYVPSTDNIMSYTHDNCYKKFTDGQGKRMRNIIASLPVLQNCVVEQTTVSTTTTTTWDVINTSGGVVDVNGILEIESGAKLTIDAGVTVRFGKQSRLIIKPNATLVLNGTLTSNTCGNTWKGVEVWGNSSTHQFTTANGQNGQGRFYGNSGSLIENAEVAVQLWGPNKHLDSGGTISCTNTTFKNNRIGIDFFKYKNFYPSNYPPSIAGNPSIYFANFTKCSFITDNEYPHKENFAAFVNMVEVDGPSFSGCSFVNTYTPLSLDNITAFGYGIFADDSEFRVRAKCNSGYPCSDFTRSEFRGLGYGIFTGVVSSINAPYTVKQTDFYDCFVGIHNRGVMGGIMLHNDFHLGNLPTLDLTQDQIGIALNNSVDMMTIEENEFVKVAGDESVRTFGISSFNIGATNKVIRRNSFTGINVGNEAGGICGDDFTGLLYECNFNTANTEFDFLICDNDFFATNRIKKVQGNSNSAIIISSGNWFSNTGAPNDRDFSNQGSFPIDYYYKENGGALEIPDEYSGLTNLIPSDENTCPVTYCEPPCRTGSEIAIQKKTFFAERDYYQVAHTEYKNSLNNGNIALAEQKLSEASHHRQLMDDNGWMILTHAIHDTTIWNRDTIRAWLSNMNYYSTEMRLAFDYLNTAESTTGMAVLNNLPKKLDLTKEQSSDLLKSQVLFNLLAAKSGHDMNDDALKELEKIASSNGEFAAGIAKNILTRYGRFFGPENCVHRTELRRPTSEIVSNDASGLALEFQVYPNPTQEQVTFERHEDSNKMAATLFLTNITGKLVWQQELKEGVLKTTWNTSGLPSGIYFYRIIDREGKKWSGRLVVQN